MIVFKDKVPKIQILYGKNKKLPPLKFVFCLRENAWDLAYSGLDENKF
jgi:hypothetical protein